ncbi:MULTISPECIES: 50S ribosomal protein L21 [Maritimibacter]|uniref:Large ribosomal subunit protein bL21 n=1 Tax=Maritimibacter alkaliphilus HTCC2654 TaxID=314271 RepID=A3VKE7_9RHOB|nr:MULTISPECIES: 50S ribosomal protein L21 [Maritimibacter]EAQ11271.1 ribosomal protein L21 [Maritimibacter alkaliphilus HTCC2654]MBL6429467.1 50S ribosomal protein L21 [Maritimibacter sp.]TYP81490.1 LSU ribosomal protein L21P [Maritimibacter alkaliphilus HTCC2654]
MFAVVKTGGKQYKVQTGDVVRVEKLAAEAGEKIQFNEVLMVGTTLGTPLVEGAGVQAEVIDQIKGEKLIHFVKRRRKHSSQRTKGHRQQLTLLRITDILESGADKSGIKAAIGAGSAPSAPAAAKPAKKAAPKAEAKAAPKAEAKTEAPAAGGSDDLTAINGIGPAMQKKLNEAGVNTYAELAKVDIETFDAVNVKPEWVAEAADLAK